MANGSNHHQIGLDDRTRDDDGEIWQKRSDTLVRTPRQTYGPDFAPGVRSDMRLDTLRERFGYESLSQMLKAGRPRGGNR